VVLRQQATEFARRDVDAQFVQLFEQFPLRHVALIVLVEDEREQARAEVQARQHLVGQGGQAAAAIGQEDTLPPVARHFGFEYQFLHDVLFVAVGHGSGGSVGKGNPHLDRREERGILGAFVRAGSLRVWGGGWCRLGELTGGDLRPRGLALEHGDFIAELLDGLFEGMDALVEQVDNPQEGLDQGCTFCSRNLR